ncbi:MAG: hypothetical protein IJ911_08340 [Salinivirgaceae bacterium]|nr:hypothetical protein [Salinivirgaceae bacterium]
MIFLKKASLVLLICACCFGCTNNKQSELRVTDSVATDTIQNVNNDAIEEATEEDSIQVNVGIRAVRNEDLRFVAGYPDPDYNYDYDPDYVNVSGILRIDGDSLIEESVLSDSAHILIYIRQYPEYERLFALSCERNKRHHQLLSETAASKLYVVNTKTLEKHIIDIPFSIRENGIEYEIVPIGTQIVFMNGILNLIFKCSNYEKKLRLYYSMNTANGKFEKVEPDIYRNVIVNNDRLLFRTVDDGMVMKGDTVLNALRIATPKYYGNPIFTDNLPPGIKIDPKTAAWAGGGLCLNTDDIMILYFYEKEIDDSEMLVRKFWIWNKKTKKWGTMSIKTDDAAFEYHDGYIMGNFNVSTDDAKILTRRNYAYWTKPMTKYGPYYAPGWNYKSEWQTQAPYSEGDLFLYHVDSQNMIQWNTGHGDSEILMLKDETVYYRVYDKIFKAPIINHKELGKPELVIQNALVGDVHWMFQIGN